MNKPQLENHNLFWDHIGESRHIPPVIYDGIYYALGLYIYVRVIKRFYSHSHSFQGSSLVQDGS